MAQQGYVALLNEHSTLENRLISILSALVSHESVSFFKHG
jgi:hypothetical protein